MKNFFVFSSLFFIFWNCLSQGVKVGTSPGSSDPSSILEVECSSQGFLPPRLTMAQRIAIVSPAEGLEIYNTDTDCKEYYNGTVWVSLCGSSVCQSAPSSPSEGIHVPSNTQIVWNWGAVSNANGYKWNTVNNYGNASEAGTSTT